MYFFSLTYFCQIVLYISFFNICESIIQTRQKCNIHLYINQHRITNFYYQRNIRKCEMQSCNKRYIISPLCVSNFFIANDKNQMDIYPELSSFFCFFFAQDKMIMKG